MAYRIERLWTSCGVSYTVQCLHNDFSKAHIVQGGGPGRLCRVCYIFVPHTCVGSPTKLPDTWDKSATGSTSTSVFFAYDVPAFYQYFSFTPYPNVHHPTIDYCVLSLQCGWAIAAFMSSRHRAFGDCRRILKLWFRVFEFVFSRTMA